MNHLTIAIDGPSGAGKSSLGKALATRLRIQYIDSGAVYRAVGCKAIDSGTSLDDVRALSELARSARIKMEGKPGDLRIMLDDVDVTARIRRPDVSRAASVVATIPEIREAVIEKLRKMSIGRDVVMDGRDIGTKVFPNATVKLFVDASMPARAQRRWAEERERGRDVSLESVGAELEERDGRDRTRAATPLIAAEDAVFLDTSDLGLEQVIERALEIVQSRR